MYVYVYVYMYICMYRYTYIYNIWNVVLMCIIYTIDAILRLYCILNMVYMIYIVYVLCSIYQKPKSSVVWVGET